MSGNISAAKLIHNPFLVFKLQNFQSFVGESKGLKLGYHNPFLSYVHIRGNLVSVIYSLI